ncbi:MAG TPA: type II and III secretion system protein [Burkholderiales bacterium]|nr:type II and III secretion system protein [Burkholderiales bacterium]
MKPGIRAGLSLCAQLCCGALLLAACAQTPVKPAATHLRAPPPSAEGQIPPPVQVAPLLPKPRPAGRVETYSVVVNNVRVQDLLFALARDARINVDIHSDLSGTVTLNAIDQTLPQLLARIARQVDMRYEIEGQNLSVMRDTPFLRSYKIDYLSAARNVKMSSLASTQFASSNSASGAATTSGTSTGATAQVDVTSENKLWESIVVNVKDILRETDKVIPKLQPAAAVPVGAVIPAPVAGAALAVPQQSVEFIEVASVIANRESGILFVRATSRQHEKVQEFLDQVLVGAKRQVLIEATIAEVQLNNQYQRGIDWQRLRSGATTTGRPAFGTGSSGVEFGQNSTGTPAAVSTTAFVVGGAISSLNFNFALSLLESFGDVKVLSSPKLSVLNNQTALLRVTRDIIYFSITPAQITVSGGSGSVTIPPSFTTTPLVAAEGFMMSVLPQINEADTIVLNVRPTIRRRVGNATDPNPALITPNLIPIFETREFDSVLRLQSGQIAVLGGLMQDQRSRTEDTIPGINAIPGLGELLEQRSESNTKTELVIFLRATVVREPSIDGDYRALRGELPGDDFFLKPNPARVAPPIGPGEAQR